MVPVVSTDSHKRIKALALSTIAFAVSFSVWTLFSVVGVRIAEELRLSDTQFGLLIATPILSGSLMRLPLGLFADRYGGRRVYTALMLCVTVSVFMLNFATHYCQYLAIGLLMGLAGATFAVGTAYVSAWFGVRHQGAAITNLGAPLLIAGFGWATVPTAYAIAMLAMAVLFWLLADEDPLHADRMRSSTRLPLRGNWSRSGTRWCGGWGSSTS